MTPAMLYLIYLLPMAVLMVAHFIGDFPLQTQWMASNKSNSLFPLSVHIAVYTSALFAVMSPMIWFASNSGFTAFSFSLENCVILAVANGLAHFLVDFVTSRLTGWAWKKQKIRLFFLIIGFDQMLHLLFLLFSIPLFLC